MHFTASPEFILEVNIKQSDRRPHMKPSLATLSVLMVFSDTTDRLQTLDSRGTLVSSFCNSCCIGYRKAADRGGAGYMALSGHRFYHL